MRTLLLLAVLYLSVLHPGAQAHEGRPIVVQIFEIKPGITKLHVNMPLSIPAINRPVVKLAGSCAAIKRTQKLEIMQPSGLFLCQEPGLKGANLEVQYPKGNPGITTLILTKLADGREIIATMPPDTLRYVFPVNQSFFHVAFDYTKLGTLHILGGLDHLLFVFGLFLLVQTNRQLLIVLSGFTIAHSITLAISTLGWIEVSVPPTEALIALSIVFVARELVSEEKSFTGRYPAIVAFGFGLLHGFGFASVLGEIGLPDDNLVSALLFFNVGVEIGQISFVIILSILAGAWKMYFVKVQDDIFGQSLNPHRPIKFAGYCLGCIASLWFCQRIIIMMA